MRVPPDGSVVIQLETHQDICRLIIEDNGFVLSKDQFSGLENSFHPQEDSFIKEPNQDDLSKAAEGLGWIILWKTEKEKINITEIQMTSLGKNIKASPHSNIINLFNQ